MLGTFFKAKKLRYARRNGFLPVPATHSKNSTINYRILLIIVLLVLAFQIVRTTFQGIKQPLKTSLKSLPQPHPRFSKFILQTSGKYIVPQIEHAPLLKKLGLKNLLIESKVRDSRFLEMEKTVVFSLNSKDDPSPSKQRAKEEEEEKGGKGLPADLAKAKNAFKNMDKKVYKPKNNKNYPEVIVVTAVDFEAYSLESLVKIVQNRIDYGHHNNYGVYVRWAQEFLPVLNSMTALNNKERAKWIRIFCLRAAMFAFPRAKWFWYLDQDSLIMREFIDLKDYLLSSEALDPIILRDQPIIPPDGEIKTFKNSKAESATLILTQSENKLETTSFLVKNDHIGRAMMDIWGSELYLTYNGFPYGPDSALTHILQWHPFYLSKTLIIPPRTIAAKHSDVDLPKDKNGKSGDHIHYDKGDLVVLWPECELQEKCESTLNHYYNILKKEKETKN